jgi:uncharacterized membrane protein (TIGR02234 family)
VVAAGGVLVFAGRAWQTITAPRPRPLADEVLGVSGRTLEPAVAALALVALAGVVAVVATRGPARRLVGVLLVLTGLGLAWRSLHGLAAVSPSHALSLLRDAHSGVGLDAAAQVHVEVHRIWPLGAGVGALVVVTTGALIAWRGPAWSVLPTRYEAPPARVQPDVNLWTALDRGEDPTSRSEP